MFLIVGVLENVGVLFVKIVDVVSDNPTYKSQSVFTLLIQVSIEFFN